MDWTAIVQPVAMLITAGAIYGGIRASLAGVMRDVARIEKSADKAHDRITDHLDRHHAQI